MRLLLYGTAFGFLLSRVGATDPDLILDMFLLRDLHLVGDAGNLWGGLLFGTGWALTGTCPGTALAQVGEGQLLALATVAGLLAGVAAYLRTEHLWPAARVSIQRSARQGRRQAT